MRIFYLASLHIPIYKNVKLLNYECDSNSENPGRKIPLGINEQNALPVLCFNF